MTVIDLLNKIANNDFIPNYIEYVSNGNRNVMMVCLENIIDKLNKGELYLNTNVYEYNPGKKEEQIKGLQTKIDKAVEYIENNWIDYETAKPISKYALLDVTIQEIRELLDILRGEE